uniref:Variant surface glycoprotein 1125.1419 n=1 Tax=Trypanosoma brucei TaxID=5691 RepID=A0A1J0R6Y3_9TRYP|nr:variant surface glycoprotein 1125.1419 [Trypanosoma brucei]
MITTRGSTALSELVALTGILSLLLFFATTTTRANSAKGDNAMDFAALCVFANMAQTVPSAPPSSNTRADLAKQIVAINMTIGGTNFLAGEDLDKEITDVANKGVVPNTGDKRTKWENNWKLWQSANTEIQKGADKTKYTVWKKSKLTRAAKAKIAAAADEAVAYFKTAVASQQKDEHAAAIEASNKALYGSDGTERTTPTVTAGSRAEICGAPNSNTNRHAGKSIQLDIICLFASGQSGADTGETCFHDCNGSTQALAAVNWAPASTNAQLWPAIKEGCKKGAATMPLTQTNLATATVTFMRLMTTKRAFNNNEISALAGTMHNSGSAGCGGNKASNGGCCILYDNSKLTEGTSEIT